MTDTLFRALRFGLPTGILIAFISVSREFSEPGWALLLSVLCAVATSLCLPRSAGTFSSNLPAFCVLIILLLANHGQLFVHLLDPQRVMLTTRRPFPRGEVLDAAYEAACFGVIAFVAGVLLVRRRRTGSAIAVEDHGWSRAWMIRIAVVAAVADISSMLLMASFGVGVMGTENGYLPYRSAGLIFYTRYWVAPFLIVAWLYAAILRRDNFHRNVAFAVLLLHGLSDGLLRSSRGSVVGVAVLALLLIARLPGGVQRRAILRGALVALAFGTAVFPVMSIYRNSRISNPGASISDMMAGSVKQATDATPLSEVPIQGLWSVLFRPSGIESLVVLTANEGAVLPITDLFNTTRYFNASILKIADSAHHGEAPSLIGSFYIVGGLWGALLGMFAFGAIVQFGWSALSCHSWTVWKVPVEVLYTWIAIDLAVDGVLDGLPLIAVSCGTAFVVMVAIARLTRRRDVRRPSASPGVTPQVGTIARAGKLCPGGIPR